MFARISAFLVWALVAGTAVFWALRLTASPPQAPAHTVPVGEGPAAMGDLARLLGATPAAAAAPTAQPVAASRFRLVGVMAPLQANSQTRYGYALIAVDGKAPRPYAVGAKLDDGLVLKSVSRRAAAIGPAEGAPSVQLELPPLAAPATGSLPPVDFSGGGSALPGMGNVPQPQSMPNLPPQSQVQQVQPVEQMEPPNNGQGGQGGGIVPMPRGPANLTR